jgi:hypothetical protein
MEGIDPQIVQQAMAQLLAQQASAGPRPPRDETVHNLSDEMVRARLVRADGRNAAPIACRDCGLPLLSTGQATLIEHAGAAPAPPPSLPRNRLAASGAGGEGGAVVVDGPEMFSWLVPSVQTFDNVAFSRPKDDLRFLLCCDCEREVLGCHELPAGGRILVSTARVTYVFL